MVPKILLPIIYLLAFLSASSSTLNQKIRRLESTEAILSYWPGDKINELENWNWRVSWKRGWVSHDNVTPFRVRYNETH